MPSNTTRIAKNTLMLYFRQILIMLVSLYTVRVVLNTLGAEDYGIYNVVAGVVTMFGFLSNSMATATQRYLSFELGRNNHEKVQQLLSLSLIIYVLLGVIIIILGETIGLWFVNNKLVIPADRMKVVQWIYHFAMLSFLLTMITTPYMAMIIAHEDMNIYAYMSIVEALLKLGVVFVLQTISLDKLKIYGILMCAVVCINTAIYRFICIKKYKESKFRWYLNFAFFKELVKYANWTFVGSMSSVVRNQGINILLNMYFGPIVNAARVVARQVDAAVITFVQNFSVALRPQMVKSYANDDKAGVLHLYFQSTKIMFFLFFCLFLPLQLELPFILKIWLKEIPEYVLVFTRIVLLEGLAQTLGYSVIGLAHATGKIKLFYGIGSGINIMNVPIALIALTVGFSSISVLVIGVILEFLSVFSRLIIVSRQLPFSLLQYIKNTIIPIFFTAILGSIIPMFFVTVYPPGLLRVVLSILISSTSLCIFIYFIGLSLDERTIVKKIVQKYIISFKKKTT
jgi:O-antigen/teichoic acid export membrane protein